MQVPFDNYIGTLVTPMRQFPDGVGGGTTNTTLDATGESFFAIGHILLSSGPGTSATCSSAGGKIYWTPGATTFAAGASRFRVGLQDITAAGLNDDAFDVHKELVGGTDTITASVVNTATMASGSKTVTHGDQICIGCEFTARTNPDSVVIARSALSSCIPYSAVDTGAGPALVTAAGFFTVEFDNGVMGWLGVSQFAAVITSSANFSSNSTPDEYALVFKLPHRATAYAAYMRLTSLASTDDFEVILYGDPLGTPVALPNGTITQDMSFAAASTIWDRPFSVGVPLAADTYYALALRPTTTNTLGFTYVDFGSGNGNLRKTTMLGTDWYQATRTNQTGAFGSADTTKLPNFGLWLSFDDGNSGSGAGWRGGIRPRAFAPGLGR